MRQIYKLLMHAYSLIYNIHPNKFMNTWTKSPKLEGPGTSRSGSQCFLDSYKHTQELKNITNYSQTLNHLTFLPLIQTIHEMPKLLILLTKKNAM